MSEESEPRAIAVIDAMAPEGWRKRVAQMLLPIALGSRQAAKLYSIGREVQSTVDGRAIVDKALAEAVAKQAIADPLQIERAKARFLGSLHEEQENLEAVMRIVQDKLETAPALSGSAEQRSSDDAVSELDSDWSTKFVREAEAATSEHMRSLLAGILDGEVRAPGSFPKSVFRALVELEKTDIETIRACSKYVLENLIGPLENTSDAALILKDAGLIDVSMMAPRGLSLVKKEDGLHARLIERGDLGLLLESVEAYIPLDDDYQVLSRAGRAAFDIIAENKRADLTNLGRRLKGPGRKLTFVRITKRENGMTHFEHIEELSNLVETPTAF